MNTDSINHVRARYIVDQVTWSLFLYNFFLLWDIELTRTVQLRCLLISDFCLDFLSKKCMRILATPS